MSKPIRTKPRSRLFLFVTLIAVVTALFFFTPARTRATQLINLVRYKISPPDAVVFVPQIVDNVVGVTPQILEATPTLVRVTAVPLTKLPEAGTLIPQPTATPTTQPTPTVTPTPTPSPTPLPINHQINGIEYQDQHGLWNYCGPANLAMLITYWGEPTDRLDTGGFLRGGIERNDDKNVSLDEMVEYVQTQTEFEALARRGGTVELLKQVISAEFPLIIEIGYTPDAPNDWMGHYLLLNGYDDASQQFTTQDSYTGRDQPYDYMALSEVWQAFNYRYIVAYSSEREQELLQLLADGDAAATRALTAALAEVDTLSGQAQYFAQLNIVDSYVLLNQYDAAAAALDTSFVLYAELPQGERPWRTMWYRFEAFEAYFMTGRYVDVINLATSTLDTMPKPILEEVYYWRALAYYEQGKTGLAIADMQMVVSLNAGFKDAQVYLDEWQ